jgi:hypothetical protein
MGIRQFSAAARTWLARVHFWIHNIALPVMMVNACLNVPAENDARGAERRGSKVWPTAVGLATR